jgi:hypothetical protein
MLFIRIKNTVMNKNKGSLGWPLHQIADCVRTDFCPCAIGDPRGRLFVRATSQSWNNGGHDASRHTWSRLLDSHMATAYTEQ